MIITGMKHFESVCQKKLVEWYYKNRPETPIDLGDVFIVWSCKTLQNYKCLASTTVSGDGIYAEYTFNTKEILCLNKSNPPVTAPFARILHTSHHIS